LVIRTEDLTKRYGSNRGCEKICLRVRRGHIFGFLGPNGAGKSTFIKMMVGLHRPTSGTAELLGRPLGDLDARRRVGFLPESFRYQEWMTPRELLRFHGQVRGMPTERIAENSARVLAAVGLAEKTDQKLRRFSKGMQQRFGLAAALLDDPELLFLDEPSSALDPIGRAAVRELLVDVRDRGTTVFLNSHLLGEVERICDEVAVIDHGRLVESGTLDELLAGPCEVEIDLAAPMDPAAAERAMSRASGRVSEASPQRLVVGLPDDSATPVLVEALVSEGGRVSGVARRRRTLESLFFEVTSEHEMEVGADE
jgi:ABC-2 type transport system ATP-binding protein